MLDTLLKTTKSEELYKRAEELIPGGVNSPVRSFKAVGGNPLFISKGNGAYIYDADENEYIDFINSWGALIHGHCHPKVISAVEESLKKGLSFGASHEKEIELAEIITSRVPSIEKVRAVNSGTEAVMTAIRLARAYTKRNKVIKFTGCYHGHSDPVLSMSGSGVATHGLPSCEGVTKHTASETITVPFNDPYAVDITFSKYPKDIACIIVEPVVGNSGLIKPKEGFLELLRQLTERYGALLIFDEVMTGFRISSGGAQTKYNIKPDLTTLGKIIGGGLPIGAVGGKKEIMDLLAPNGPVYQAGTLSGNPVAVSCGIATLNLLEESTYSQLESLTSTLCKQIADFNKEKGLDIQVSFDGSMFSVFFNENEVQSYEDAKSCNSKKFMAFFKGMLSKGIYLAPSQYEANFVSTAHTVENIDAVINAYKEVVVTL